MTQQRTALLATTGSWLAVALALALTLLLDTRFSVLLVFTAITALTVTFFWSRASRRAD